MPKHGFKDKQTRETKAEYLDYFEGKNFIVKNEPLETDFQLG